MNFDRDIAAFDNLLGVRDALASLKGYRPNGPSGDRDHDYWWDTPDGGSLNIRLSEKWISVDTHAHWQFVLEALECVTTVYPDTLIMDPQSFIFYDASAFERFVEETYARKRKA